MKDTRHRLCFPDSRIGISPTSYNYFLTSLGPRQDLGTSLIIDTIHSVDVKRLRIRMIYGEFVNQSLNRSRAQLQERTGCT